MAEPLALVRPEPNKDLVVELRELLEQAERGEVTRCVIVKLRPDHSFAVTVTGVGSDLVAVGALAFAQHDLMVSNEPGGGKS
jgi:hypothetical protein